MALTAACGWVEAAVLLLRLRSVEEVYEWRQVAEDASGDSQGVEDPELADECGRMVVEAAMVKR